MFGPAAFHSVRVASRLALHLAHPSMRLGVDLGGTKIEALALADDGREVVRRRVPTPRAYDATLDAVAALVGDVARDADAAAATPVGVGIPGAVVPATGLVKNANSTWLNGRPLERDLAGRLGRRVRLTNDANCFALSEAGDGAGAGAPTVFGVILGTGVGGGVVVNGACLTGANSLAGEWGHNPLPWARGDELPGPPCYCGRTGCVEQFLSGPAFARDHAMHATPGAGEEPTTYAIVEAAARGDQDARASLTRYHDRLARALAVVVNLLDPDVIVLGGGMSNVPGVAEAAQAQLGAYLFSATGVANASTPPATRIVRARHGDSSGVRGAAWLWPIGA